MQRDLLLQSIRGALTFALICIPVASGAVIDEYTAQEQESRQNSFLQTCRSGLDLTIDFDRGNEFGPFTQARDLLCELEAQERGLGSPAVAGPDAEAHFRAMVNRLNYMLDNRTN